MPDIHDVMDVTMDDLSPEQQMQLKDAIDQFQQKCLMSFGKNRSGVVTTQESRCVNFAKI
jgi:hypothetical protein